MKADILAFGAHPDDIELSCSGTILRHISLGKKVAIVDLTRGELGTRGTPEIREKEASHASEILGVTSRENLDFDDGFFQHDKKHQLEVIKMIRKYQPEIVLTNALHDRHPDHKRGCDLVTESCFLAGLAKISTSINTIQQNAWRPRSIYHYIQDQYITPDFIVDISEFMNKKMETIKAFKSQFFDLSSKEPETYISSAGFMESIIARAREFGKVIGVEYGEGFASFRTIGVKNITDLL